MYWQYLAFPLTTVLLFQLTRLFHTLTLSPLQHIPGPFWARLTGAWYLFCVRKGSFEHENIALHQKYGPIVRLTPIHYSIDDPNAIKVIYGLGSKFPKSEWYDGFQDPSSDRWSIFLLRNMHAHAEARKSLQRLYTMSSVVTYESYVDDCSDLLCDRLLELSNRGDRLLDLSHWLFCYAFDVVIDLSCGQRMGFLDKGQDVGHSMQNLRRFFEYSSLAGIYTGLHRMLFPILKRIPGSGPGRRQTMLEFVGKQIGQRRQQRNSGGTRDNESSENFLDRILDAQEEDPKKVTDYHVFMMLVANVFAGSDTTGSTLSAAVYRLLTNPEALSKLREEVHRTSPGQQNNFSFKESQEMPYLQAVLKETMRLHPAVGLPLWRTVPAEGANIAGSFFPAGTNVGINAWVAHHNKHVFGEDADEFRPDRWLDEKQERHADMEAYWIPFGLGSRSCLGRHISMLEMSKLIPRLVRDFNFDLVEEPSKAWQTSNYWFVKPKSLRVRITRRHKS